MELSIIVPILNEEKNINVLYDKIKENLKKVKYEIIFVNDGSIDNTDKIIEKIHKKDKNVKLISFSRNFGKDAAIYAGMKYSCGEYTAIIDGDMQQDPKYLVKMLDFLEKNNDFDQVCMVPRVRKHTSFLKRVGGNLFYRLMNKISPIKIINGASDFRMFKPNIKDAVLSLNEIDRFSKGLFSWVGFNTEYLEYDVGARLYGKTKFNLKKSIIYAIDGIVSFSIKPLLIFLGLGIIFSIGGFIATIYLIVKSIIHGYIYSKFAFMIAILIFLFVINLIAITILGMYIAKIHVEVKKRPIYIIKNMIGLDSY